MPDLSFGTYLSLVHLWTCVSAQLTPSFALKCIIGVQTSFYLAERAPDALAQVIDQAHHMHAERAALRWLERPTPTTYEDAERRLGEEREKPELSQNLLR